MSRSRKLWWILAITIILVVGIISGGRYLIQERPHQQLTVVVPKLSPEAAAGETVFSANCAVCHGKNAAGTDKGPPLIDPIYRPAHHGDFSFVRAVTLGVPQHHWLFGAMPAQPQVTREQIDQIVTYIREIQRANGINKPFLKSRLWIRLPGNCCGAARSEKGIKVNRDRIVWRSIIYGIAGMAGLLGIYFVILAAVSGWEFTVSQFLEFWYFIVSLAAGFGIQIGLYSYLRNAVRGMDMSGKVVAVSGTTSTAAMISCCAHYLTNILPVIGAAGAVALVAQYQIELFWIGLACNLAGILYMGNRVVKFSKAHAAN